MLNDPSKSLFDRHPCVHTYVQTPHKPYRRGGYAWQWDKPLRTTRRGW